MVHTLLVALALLGCLAWLAGCVAALATRRAVLRLADQPLPAPGARLPTLSIVVPARDEAATLPAAAASLLAQRLPGLEFVFVDDRSRDHTGALLDALAAADPRVRALHVAQLPPGWLGKVHALHVGAAAARGEWLLFTDADVHVRPGCLERALAFAEARALDHLVVLPGLPREGFLLECAYAAFGRSFVLSQRLWAVSDPRSSAATGVGAFNLVRRAHLERTPGFEWLKLDVADDLALGLLLKSHGGRCAVLSATDLLSVRWYDSLPAMLRGLEKNTFAIAGCRLSTTAVLAVGSLLLDFAPLLALAGLGHAWLSLLGAGTLAVSLAVAAVSARWAGRPLLPALCFPVGSLLLSAIVLRAGLLGWRRGGVVWRDTFHASAELRRGARVSLLRPRSGR